MADYSNPETVAALSKIDPELDAVLKAHPFPSPDWGNLPKMREMRAAMEASRGATEEEAKLQHAINIKMRDGYESEVIVHRSENPPEKSPLIVLLFGGGFVVGSNIQLGPYARGLAKIYGATVVTLSYRLAPEHKFPTAPHDVWDSVTWLAKNAGSFGADPSVGFILGGVSAGGNLTAVTAQRYHDEKLSPPLTGLWVCIPVLLNEHTVPDKYKHLWLSHEQNAKAPVFNSDAIQRVEEYYAADVHSPEWSPFNLKHAHTGLPPSYFQVCGMDPLRDDGLIYEAVLREHGVKTKLDVYPGVPHGHFSFLPNLKSSRTAVADTVKGFGWLLGTEAPSDEQIKASVAPPKGA